MIFEIHGTCARRVVRLCHGVLEIMSWFGSLGGGAAGWQALGVCLACNLHATLRGNAPTYRIIVSVQNQNGNTKKYGLALHSFPAHASYKNKRTVYIITKNKHTNSRVALVPIPPLGAEASLGVRTILIKSFASHFRQLWWMIQMRIHIPI